MIHATESSRWSHSVRYAPGNQRNTGQRRWSSGGDILAGLESERVVVVQISRSSAQAPLRPRGTPTGGRDGLSVAPDMLLVADRSETRAVHGEFQQCSTLGLGRYRWTTTAPGFRFGNTWTTRPTPGSRVLTVRDRPKQADDR